LYVRGEIEDALPTYKVRPAESKLETGTGNFEGYAGALAAVEYVAELGVRFGDAASGASRRARVVAGMRSIRAYEIELYRRLATALGRIRGVTLLGLGVDEVERRTPTAAITVDGFAPRDVATRLGDQGIAVWDGDFYATGLMERLGLAPDGVVRIGLSHYNTEAEVDRLLDALTGIAGGAGEHGTRTAAAATA
jgi:selenocysteine lyase/cysteine desulfurase